MTDLLAFGVVLLAVAVLGVALTEVLMRRADVAAGLVLGVTVLNAALLDEVPALVSPGGMRLQVYDVVFALLFTQSAIVRPLCGLLSEEDEGTVR